MPDSEAMTIDERRKRISPSRVSDKRMQRRYLAADREKRGRLLTDLEELAALHRESLVRLLRLGDLPSFRAKHVKANGP